MQDVLPEATIRPATLADAEPIAAVHIASWRDVHRGVVPEEYLEALDEADRAAQWRETLSAGHATTLVAEQDGQVVGFASFGASSDEDAERGTIELYAIYLEPAAWGHGVARQLMRELIGSLPDGTPVTLWVGAHNERAHRFYRRHGFAQDGVERIDESGGAAVPQVRYRRS